MELLYQIIIELSRALPTTERNASLEFAIGEGYNTGHSISIRLTSPDGEIVLSSNSLDSITMPET